MEPIVLTEADDGVRVSPAPGQAVVLRLPENPTTGYRWQVPDGAAIDRDDFAAAATDAAGAGGERVLTLAAGQAGTLAFALVRPWETDAPERRFTIHLTPARQGTAP